MTFLEFLCYAILFLIEGFVLFFILIIVLMTMGLRNKFAPPPKTTPLHERIFNWVVEVLMRYARLFKISYYAINILVYYFLVPFTWIILLDLLFEFHYLKVGFLFFCIGFAFFCKDFNTFSMDLYKQSVNFLNYFNRFGSNYVKSSVWICVFVPIVIYSTLIYMLIY